MLFKISRINIKSFLTGFLIFLFPVIALSQVTRKPYLHVPTPESTIIFWDYFTIIKDNR